MISDEMPPLKIVSWNIGLRGLQQLCSAKATDLGAADVHGISRRMGFGSLGAMLQHLDADIVCLQEVKMAQLGAPERAIALAQDSLILLLTVQDAENASTSFGRYAGTATFCKTRVLQQSGGRRDRRPWAQRESVVRASGWRAE